VEIDVFQNYSWAAMHFDARGLHQDALIHVIPRAGYRLSNSIGQRSGYALEPRG
jgi:hypothetical protein